MDFFQGLTRLESVKIITREGDTRWQTQGLKLTSSSRETTSLRTQLVSEDTSLGMDLLSVCSEIPFRGRGTFGLENSSGAEDKEQLIFSLSHQLVGQGAATNKDRLTGDSDILIRLWMFFRPYVLHVMKRATGRRGKWLIEQLTQTTVDIRGFSRMRHLSCSATLDLSLEPNNTDSLFKKKKRQQQQTQNKKPKPNSRGLEVYVLQEWEKNCEPFVTEW